MGRACEHRELHVISYLVIGAGICVHRCHITKFQAENCPYCIVTSWFHIPVFAFFFWKAHKVWNESLWLLWLLGTHFQKNKPQSESWGLWCLEPLNCLSLSKDFQVKVQYRGNFLMGVYFQLIYFRGIKSLIFVL